MDNSTFNNNTSAKDENLPFYTPNGPFFHFETPSPIEQNHSHYPSFVPAYPQPVVPFFDPKTGQFYTPHQQQYPFFHPQENAAGRSMLSLIFLSCIIIFHLLIVTLGAFNTWFFTRIRILICVWSGLLALLAICLMIVSKCVKSYRQPLVWAEVLVMLVGIALEVFAVYLLT